MFPIITNSHMSEANKNNCCAFCNKEMPSDNYWMTFGGGFSIHRHFHDGTGETLNVIDNDVGQQADLGFCSSDCATFFILQIAKKIE